MKTNDYFKLKKTLINFNKIIKQDLVFVACNFTNIIKDHPEYFRQKIDIVNKNVFQYSLYFIYELVKIILDLFKSFSSRKIKLRKTDKEVLFISHLTNSNKIGTKDNYYHNIKKVFNNQKIITYYINHTKNHYRNNFFENKYFISNNFNIGLLNELKIIKMQFNFFFRILKLKNKNRYNQKINNLILFEIFKTDTKKNLRMFFQIEEIIKNSNIKCIILTCEGYAHEKMIFNLSFKNKIASIGYQNIPLLKNQILIDKSLKTYLPKIIWTSDKSSQQILKKYFKKQIKIINIGSKNYFTIQRKNNFTLKNKCLVIPEGFTTETLEMFKMVDNFLKNNKNNNLKFIFRIHPNLNDIDLYKKLKFYSEKNKKFFLSFNKFDNDIKKSDIVIFRGSSAVINCFKNELIPIYFKNNENIEINPLNIKKNKFFTIKDEKGLSKLLNKLTSKKRRLMYKKKITNFDKNVYQEINILIIKKSLKQMDII